MQIEKDTSIVVREKGALSLLSHSIKGRGGLLRGLSSESLVIDGKGTPWGAGCWGLKNSSVGGEIQYLKIKGS